jgi:hypothetical protein
MFNPSQFCSTREHLASPRRGNISSIQAVDGLLACPIDQP